MPRRTVSTAATCRGGPGRGASAQSRRRAAARRPERARRHGETGEEGRGPAGGGHGLPAQPDPCWPGPGVLGTRAEPDGADQQLRRIRRFGGSRSAGAGGTWDAAAGAGDGCRGQRVSPGRCGRAGWGQGRPAAQQSPGCSSSEGRRGVVAPPCRRCSRRRWDRAPGSRPTAGSPGTMRTGRTAAPAHAHSGLRTPPPRGEGRPCFRTGRHKLRLLG